MLKPTTSSSLNANQCISPFCRWSKGITQGYVGQIVDDILDDAGVDTARISMFGVDRVRNHCVSSAILVLIFFDLRSSHATTMLRSLC